MRHCIYIFAIAIFSLNSCTSSYQAKPLEPQKVLQRFDELTKIPPQLSLAQAQSLALLHHPTLQKLRAELGFANAADLHAESSPDPVLSLSPFWIVPQAALGVATALHWEILPSGTKETRRGLAATLRSAIHANIASAEWKLAMQARIAWLELVGTEKKLILANRVVEQARENKNLALIMLDSGVITREESAALEIAYSTEVKKLAAAQSALLADQENLCAAIGLPPHCHIETQWEDDPLLPLEPNVPQGETDKILLARHPELFESYARYMLAEKELELTYLESLPKVFLGPEVERDADNTFLGIGASITIPLTDKNRVRIEEAKTRRDLTAHIFEETLFTLRATLTKTQIELEMLAQSIQLHETEILPKIKEFFFTQRAMVEAGAGDLLSLFQAQSEALAAEQTSLELRISYAVALARLEEVYGPEPAESAKEKS